ncbi:hypothetical protein FQN49_008483, partial [Arthroderma sp. PD_2]
MSLTTYHSLPTTGIEGNKRGKTQPMAPGKGTGMSKVTDRAGVRVAPSARLRIVSIRL